MSQRYCKKCGGWHDLNEPWPEACYRAPASSGLQIIKDIEPYKAVAVDIATGKPPKIGSRREHREFLKRNGYHERGNDPIRPRKAEYADVNPREIAQTVERIKRGEFQ